MKFQHASYLLSVALLLGACETSVIGIGGGEQAEPATGAPRSTTDQPANDTLEQLLGARDPLELPEQRPSVAILLPLTGPQAKRGQDLLDAAQLALFDVAAEEFELKPFDTGGTADGARTAANAALNEGARLILGPLTAGSTRAAVFPARRNGVNILSFSNDRSVAGNGVFVMGFLPQAQVARVVDYAQRNSLRSFAALAPRNTYGNTMVNALQGATAADPLSSVVATTSYVAGDENLPELIKQFADYDERRQALLQQRAILEARDDTISQQALARLENRETLGDVPFDAILLPGGSEEALQLAPLLAFYDVDPVRVRLLGTWLWDNPRLGDEPNMVGAWFAAPPPAARQDFENRFEALYGRQPDRLATLAYDAVALAAILGANDADGDPYSIDSLTTANGFAGMDGIFRLLPSGEVQRGLAVLEVQRGGAREIEPAPESFESIVN